MSPGRSMVVSGMSTAGCVWADAKGTPNAGRARARTAGALFMVLASLTLIRSLLEWREDTRKVSRSARIPREGNPGPLASSSSCRQCIKRGRAAPVRADVRLGGAETRECGTPRWRDFRSPCTTCLTSVRYWFFVQPLLAFPQRAFPGLHEVLERLI